MSVKVSVVIPTKNAGPGFRQTLEMIFAQQVPYPFEVIVVDSGSQDATLDICREFPVRLLQIPPKSFNHGATRNYAISQAQGEFIVLTVQDAVPADKGWMDALVRNLIDDPEVAGAYGRQVPRPDSSYLAKQRNRLWYKRQGNKRIVHRISDLAELDALTIEEKCLVVRFDNVNGCIRRSVWEQYNFPPYMYAEDIGWALEVLQAGYRIVYDPTAQVLHSHDRGLDYELRRAYIDARVVTEILGATPRPIGADQACQLLAFLLQECAHCLSDIGVLAKSVEESMAHLPTLGINQVRESFALLIQECDQRWRNMEASQEGDLQALVVREEIAHLLDSKRWHRSIFDVECVRYIFGPDSPWPEEERQWLLKELDWLEECAVREKLGEEGWHRSLFDVECVRYIFGPDSPWPEEERQWLLKEIGWIDGRTEEEWYRSMFNAESVHYIFGPDSPWSEEQRQWLLKELDWLEEVDWIKEQARWGNKDAIEWLRERGELEGWKGEERPRGSGPRPWPIQRLSGRIADSVKGVKTLDDADVAFIFKGLWAKLGKNYIKDAISSLLASRILSELEGVKSLTDTDVEFIFHSLWTRLGKDYVKGAVSDVAASRRRKLSERIFDDLADREALDDGDVEFIFESLWTKLGKNYVKGAVSDLIAVGKQIDALAEAKKAFNESVRDLCEEAQRKGHLTKGLFWRVRLYGAATAIGKQLGLAAYSNLKGQCKGDSIAFVSVLSSKISAWAKRRGNQENLWDNLGAIIADYLSETQGQLRGQGVKQTFRNAINTLLPKISGKSRKRVAEERFWRKLDKLLGKGI